MRPIPIICGPTAGGKTAVALELARAYPIEIVSADSRQLVKHLNIGTAKPTAEQRQRVPFHLIDIIEPGERYSAFRFISDAGSTIEQIIKRGNLPVIVGGTGLYLRALTDGVVEIEQGDIEIRDRLEREMAELGCEAMHARLQGIDPLEAIKMHPNNKVRVIRALEIYYLTGKAKSEITATGDYKKSHFPFKYFCLAPSREPLYDTINQRVVRMIRDGLEQEFESLVSQGYLEKIRRANIIGYNELIARKEGRLSFEQAVSEIQQNSRRYAKRQLTWFRGQAECRFIESPDELYREAIQLLDSGAIRKKT